jgi:predicted ATPase
MVLNEPETSLHPDLVAPLAGMIRSAARGTQVVVVTHSAAMREHLGAADPEGRSEATRDCASSSEIELYKEWGETRINGQTTLTTPPWDWGKR